MKMNSNSMLPRALSQVTPKNYTKTLLNSRHSSIGIQIIRKTREKQIPEKDHLDET